MPNSQCHYLKLKKNVEDVIIFPTLKVLNSDNFLPNGSAELRNSQVTFVEKPKSKKLTMNIFLKGSAVNRILEMESPLKLLI